MNQIKILERIWKTGLALFAAGILAFSGFFLALPKASATGAPNLTTRLLVNDNNDVPDQGWQHVLSSQAGHRVAFQVDIHNTVVGTVAENVHVRVAFPNGAQNTINVP